MPALVGEAGSLESVIVLLLWGAGAVALVLLARQCGARISAATIPGVLILATLGMQYLGLPILYFGWDGYRAEFVTDRSMVAAVWVYTTAALAMLLFGLSAARTLLTRLPVERLEQVSWLSERLRRFPLRGERLLFLMVLGVLALYLTKVGLDNVALLVAITASPADASLSRSLMGSDFAGRYHWYALFFRELSQVVAFAALVHWGLRRSWGAAAWCIVTCATCAVALLMAGEKAPIVYFLLGLMCVHAIVWNNGRFVIRVLFTGSAAAVTIVATLYIVVMGDRDIGAALWSIVSRGFTGSVQPAYHYLEAFPAHLPFLWGASFPNPGGMFPFNPVALTREVYDWVFARNPLVDPVVGTMPTVWWGELYANFGNVGVLLGSALLGIGIGVVDAVARRVALGPMGIALYVWMILYVKDLSVSGASDRVLGVYVAGLGLLTLGVSTTMRLRLTPPAERRL